MKRIIKISVLVLAVCVLLGAAAVLVLRPDVRFRTRVTVMDQFPTYLTSYQEDFECDTEKVSAFDTETDDTLMLVNTDHPLPMNYTPDIIEYKDSGVLMAPETADAYALLSADIENKFGQKLYIMSSYRTAEEQADIQQEQGSDTAMPPECSEHQTGLALDVYFQGFAGEGIIKTEAGRYLNEHCWEYGFIIRYPAGKSGYTGIDYEPWHLRYVGRPHAELIYKGHLSLEEYIEHIQAEPLQSYEAYLISCQSGPELELPTEYDELNVSRNNCGEYVITVKLIQDP